MSRLVASQRAWLAPAWVREDLSRKAQALPSLDLRFAESKSLTDAASGQSLVTFTRASSGTYVGSDGVLKTATTNEPRFDHNPTTGESLGLLVEEQRTNLLQRSEEFDNAYWTKGGSTISANSATAPDGLTTADKLAEDTSTGNHRLFVATTSLAANTAHSLSVYVKAAGRTFIRVEVRDSVGAFAAQDFNLTTLAITTAGSGTGTISSLGNGWYRCTVTGTSSASGGLGTALFWALSAPSGTSYTGDGTSGLLLWGAQLEAGSFPTSYIPTTTATATRSADVASITGTNFSSWYRQDEGTVFASAVRTASPQSTVWFGVASDGTTTNRMQFGYGDSAGNYAVIVGGSVTGQAYPAVSTLNRNGAFAYGQTGAISYNGAIPSQFALSSLPVANQLSLGSYVGNVSGFLGGTIRRLTYWPARLANSTLQAITQ